MSVVSTSLDRPDSGARRAASEFALACRVAIYEHRYYLGIILGYALVCLALGLIADINDIVDIGFYAGPFILLIITFSLLFVLGHTLWIAAVVRPEGSLFIAIGRDLRTRVLTKQRIAAFLAASALAPLFFTTFGSCKRMIPLLNPFHWDPTFMAWDRWLHFGEHPWRLLQPLLGHPLITSAFSFNYNLWFFVLIFTFIWQAMSCKQPALRMQFLIAFLLTWIILGTVLATILSSAGPVYYGAIVGRPDPYTPLMTYLYSVHESYPVWALDVQERLWATYTARGADLGSGISAMPSLHVGTSVLFALLGWRISRWAGLAYSVFAALVMIGSVHLAWHYAVDGYVSLIAMPPIWWLAGVISRRAAAKPAAVFA
jgi:PAP2 superfamily